MELLDAAERRRLTPVEAAELRRGVEHLKRCLSGAGAELRRLVDEAERVRDEHAQELLMVRQPGLEASCRVCGAAAGVWCRPVHGGGVMPRTLHVARLVDAGVLS
ncbi:hypothetical protein ACIRVF_07920 [Kitasatospora sp. NPDC101157]|uniref:zinc finger domain-containing protein n=1 Tax=Kitasatospora sp. NPDC101157 TaxID=3364098 RepID=UPI0038207D41